MPQRVLNYHIHNKFYVFTWTWIYIYTTQGPIVNEIVEEGPQLSWRAVRDKGREAGELEPGLRIRSGSGSGHLGRFRASAFFMSRTGQRIISRTRIGTKLRNRSVPGSGYFGRIRMWFQFPSKAEPDKRLEGADLEKKSYCSRSGYFGWIRGILSESDLWIWILLFKRVGSGLELSLSTFSKDPELFSVKSVLIPTDQN